MIMIFLNFSDWRKSPALAIKQQNHSEGNLWSCQCLFNSPDAMIYEQFEKPCLDIDEEQQSPSSKWMNIVQCWKLYRFSPKKQNHSDTEWYYILLCCLVSCLNFLFNIWYFRQEISLISVEKVFGSTHSSSEMNSLKYTYTKTNNSNFKERTQASNDHLTCKHPAIICFPTFNFL